MPTFIPSPGDIKDLDLRDLTDHPLLAGIPMWDRDSAEFTSLVESIRERGQDYELLADTEFRIVDGRNRRNALRVLGRPAVVKFVAKTDAASIVVSSLVNRRHLTKGALAYLVAPMFTGVLEESTARRLANLRRAGEARTSVGTDSALSALSVKTIGDVAAQLGIGERLYDQALKLRKMFEEAPADVRAKYEPRILGEWLDDAGDWQDPVGLGYMINGLTSLAGDAEKKKNLGKRAQHDRLFAGFLPKLTLHWKKATPEQRAHIATKLKAEVMKFPAELRDELASAIRAAAKAEKE